MKKLVFLVIAGLLIFASIGLTYDGGSANIPPDAVDDTAATLCGVPVKIYVLENDIDEDNPEDLYVYSYTEPLHGTVKQMRNVLTYTPAEDFSGVDSFTYKLSDFRGGWDKATVTITVDCGPTPPPPNNPPCANDDTESTACDTQVTIDVLSNDYDPDSDAVSLVGIVQGPSHGSAEISGSSIVYTSDSGYEGTDSLIYKITDGNGQYDTATVTITIDCEEPPPSECEQCGPGYGGGGKVYYLEVTYDGESVDKSAEWNSKKRKWDKFGSNTILTFSDGSWVKVHTSCSKPLYIGMTVPVYTGSYKHPTSTGEIAMVTGLITTPCVPDPPARTTYCKKCK